VVPASEGALPLPLVLDPEDPDVLLDPELPPVSRVLAPELVPVPDPELPPDVDSEPEELVLPLPAPDDEVLRLHEPGVASPQAATARMSAAPDRHPNIPRCARTCRAPRVLHRTIANDRRFARVRREVPVRKLVLHAPRYVLLLVSGSTWSW
jgi:hypothetical protein